MTILTRRAAFAGAAALALPRVAIAQGDSRPSLTIAVQRISNSNTLEPPNEQSNVGFRLAPSWAEPLIGTDWTGSVLPVPALATAWRRVDDRTVEFTLRENVRFHDGTVMTAEDVAWSIGGSRLWGGGTKAPPPNIPAVARLTFPGFERMEVVGPTTVRFVNKVPDPTLEGRLAQTVGTIFSQAAYAAAADWPTWARAPIGTGPYRIAEYRPEVSLVLEAHDEYWGGRPPAKRLRIVEVPEVASRLNGLFAGEFDFATDIPPDQIRTVEGRDRWEITGGPINNIRITTFDSTHPVLAKKEVRRALSHAVDRNAIVQSLWLGRTEVPNGLQESSFGPLYVADWKTPAFDPAEAKRLLTQAGYGGEPIPYRCLNDYYTNQTATAQILVEMWRDVGLNVALQMRENWSQVTGPKEGRGIRDWSVTSVFPDPVASMVRAIGPRGELQRGGEWQNAAFNTLSGELSTSMDPARRRAAFRQMLQIAEFDDPAYIVLQKAATFIAKRRDIQWRAAHGWPMDFGPGNLHFPA